MLKNPNNLANLCPTEFMEEYPQVNLKNHEKDITIIPLSFSDFNWPDTKNEIEKLWENHTYSISEFFNTINLMASTPRYRSCAFEKNDILASHDRICLNYLIDCKIEVPSKEDNCSENAIEVRGFPTLFLGICYSLKIMRNFTDEEALYLNLTGYVSFASEV